MEKEEKYGFLSLAKKTLSVIIASITGLFTTGQSKAEAIKVNLDNLDKVKDYQGFQKEILKSKYVIKKNLNYPNSIILAQHVSHSSHTSHSSHSSHSSHYSSNQPGHTSHSSHSSHLSSSQPPSNYNPPSNTKDELGSRFLEKGMQGSDVKELQTLLRSLGYNVAQNGTYDEDTFKAVSKFQDDNYLPVTGKADLTTIYSIQAKIK